ncbi:MAG: OmpH family outer membrane protein [Bacteroidales bacterium]|jgi:outer membrane protein|nr:OmpH family outer membrane protein [Bacteroidales bacterium]MDZ4058793.1 OmpH family outer membrane protein [Bacteroidales bacterium]
MKHLSKILLLLFILVASSGFAQNLKFGHINSQELIAVMPERDSAIVKLEKYADDLEENLQAMQSEFQTKLNTYQQRQASWTAAILESRTKELQELDARIQQYQQTASQEYQQMQQLLYAPVFQKANETIQQIGKERGLIYIFDTASGTVPYINSDMSEDILPLAKAALKIPADKKPMQTGAAPQL